MGSRNRREKEQARKADLAKARRSRLIVAGGATVLGAIVLCVLLALPKHGQNPEPAATRRRATNALSLSRPDASQPSLALSDEGPTNITAASEQLNRGTRLLEAGNIEAAIAQYEQALKLNPGDEDAHYNLALAYAKKGDRQAAEQEYLEALRIYPDYSEAHNNLGNLLVADGKLEEAIEHFRAALKISPDSASAQNNLGNALARQGKVGEAIPCFREAARLKRDYLEARNNLASAYLAQGRIDEAITEFTAILKLNPDFTPAQRGLLKARQLQTK